MNPALLLAEPVTFIVGVVLLRTTWQERLGRPALVTGVGAAVSALAAMAAGGSPTGWVLADLALLGVMGALGVYGGSAADSRLVLLAAAGATAAGLGSNAFPFALAALGLALASLLLGPDRLVDALAGGLVVQTALRLGHPEARGLSALLAAVILIPLMVSAARTLERRRRRILLRGVLGVAAFCLVGVAAGATAATLALGPLRRGLSMGNDTIAITQQGDVAAASAGLAGAGDGFARARRALEAWWVLPARTVPVVAQHWRVLHAAALSGDQLAQAGRRALGGPGLRDLRIVDGQVPLAELTAMEPLAGQVASRATAARLRLAAARSSWLLPPLLDKVDVEVAHVRKLEKTSLLVHQVLVALPSLLGRDGPRRYFLAVQTPVESRAGGGFLGNFGEITADAGRLKLTRFGRQVELTAAPGRDQRVLVAPDDFIARYSRFRPENNWSNVNLSPDFPTDAGVMAGLYPQSGGAQVDGVIAIDPAALAAVLNVVGSIQVPSWPTPITAGNALQTLLYDQYQRYSASDERIDFLGDVAQEAWRRLTTGGLPPAPQVVAALGPAIGEKHLFLSSRRPDEQRLFEDLGAAGKVAPVQGDFLGLVTQNAGGNKIDYFLQRSVDYRVELDPGTGTLQAKATITLRNDAPAGGLSPGLIGNEVVPPLPNGTNKLYLSLYTPWELADGRLGGDEVGFERATELGRHVYSTAVVIPAKSTVTLEVTLSGRLPAGGPYRLDLYRQPVVAPDAVTATLALGAGWQTSSGAQEETTKRRLVTDATIEVPLRRR